MHIIPSLIPEAVLGTKEPSEKARAAAFDFIIAMGRKMGDGGVVKRRMIDTMEEDGEGEELRHDAANDDGGEAECEELVEAGDEDGPRNPNDPRANC